MRCCGPRGSARGATCANARPRSAQLTTSCCIAQRTQGGPGRDADLVVDVLDVAVGGLGRGSRGDLADLARGQPPRTASCSAWTSRIRTARPGSAVACACAPGRLPHRRRPRRRRRGRRAAARIPSASRRRAARRPRRRRTSSETSARSWSTPTSDLRWRPGRMPPLSPVSIATACVVARAVALLVVARAPAVVQNGQRRGAARLLVGEHGVRAEARSNSLGQAGPGLSQIASETRRRRSRARAPPRPSATTASSGCPRTRAPPVASSAQRRLWPPM